MSTAIYLGEEGGNWMSTAIYLREEGVTGCLQLYT